MKNILSPYDGNHKLFNSKKSLKLSSDFNFNDYYKKLKLGKYRDINKYEIKLFESLNLIFESLINSLEGKDEILFLEELKENMISNLKDDVKFFRAKNSNEKPKSQAYQEFDEYKGMVISLHPITTKIINIISKNRIKQFKIQAKKGHTRREDLSTNGGLLNRLICWILNVDFNLQGINKLIPSYTGDSYHVGGLCLELSVSHSKWWETNYSAYSRKPKTTYYHFDESISKPKSIVYLSDVTNDNGPVKYVEKFQNILNVSPLQNLVGRVIGNIGRHKDSKIYHLFNHKYHQTFGCKKFIDFFNILPSELKFSSHFGWDVIPESILETEIMNNEKTLTGKKGTALIFDGSELLHRGGMVEKSNRVVLQVIFEKKNHFRFLERVINKLTK